MEEVKLRIKEHEGFRNSIYLDHLKNATIGWGHLVTAEDNFKEDIIYSVEELNKVFEQDFQKAKDAAYNLCSEININYIAKCVIVEMCFQLGKTGVSKFKNMFEALRKEDYILASKEMLDSIWYKQTPARAKSLSAIMGSSNK
jgi:lysozyme